MTASRGGLELELCADSTRAAAGACVALMEARVWETGLPGSIIDIPRPQQHPEEILELVAPTPSYPYFNSLSAPLVRT